MWFIIYAIFLSTIVMCHCKENISLIKVLMSLINEVMLHSKAIMSFAKPSMVLSKAYMSFNNLSMLYSKPNMSCIKADMPLSKSNSPIINSTMNPNIQIKYHIPTPPPYASRHMPQTHKANPQFYFVAKAFQPSPPNFSR
jgi:hypothetical protein